MVATGSPIPGQTRWECPECGSSCVRDTQSGDFPKSRQRDAAGEPQSARKAKKKKKKRSAGVAWLPLAIAAIFLVVGGIVAIVMINRFQTATGQPAPAAPPAEEEVKGPVKGAPVLPGPVEKRDPPADPKKTPPEPAVKQTTPRPADAPGLEPGKPLDPLVMVSGLKELVTPGDPRIRSTGYQGAFSETLTLVEFLEFSPPRSPGVKYTVHGFLQGRRLLLTTKRNPAGKDAFHWVDQDYMLRDNKGNVVYIYKRGK